MPLAEDDRKMQVNWFNKKVDRLTNIVGNKTENIIAHGGESVKQGIATSIAAVNNDVQALRGRPENFVSAAQVRAGLHAARQIAEDATEIAVQGGINKLSQAGAAVSNKAGQIKAGIQQKGSNVVNAVMSTNIGGGLVNAYQTANQAPISLAPSKILNTSSQILSAPFKAVRHPDLFVIGRRQSKHDLSHCQKFYIRILCQ